jgi:hypothetical protein
MTGREIRKLVAELNDILYEGAAFARVFDDLSDADTEALENKMFNAIKSKIEKSHDSNNDLTN